MKKKTAIIFTIAALMFVPSTARADIDVISDIERVINAITEKINMVVKQYTAVQANLQELSLNRNIVSQLRDRVKTELKSRANQIYSEAKELALGELMTFVKTSLSNVTLPGIGQYIDLGAFVNPKLTVAVGQTYIKKQHKIDDVKYVATMDKRNNDLMVDNAAILFSNSLVRRVQLIEEDPCHCVDAQNNLIPGMPNCQSNDVQACKEKRDQLENIPDVNTAKQKYFDTIMNGHQRWVRIQEMMASYSKMKAESYMNQGVIDDIGDVTGVMDDTEPEERADADAVNELMENAKKVREANTLALSNNIKNVIGDIKNGKITDVVSGVVQNASDAYANAPGSRAGLADTFSNIASGVGSAGSAINSAQNGNWGGAVSAAAGGAGNIANNIGSTDLGEAISSASTGSGAALNAALRGDWGETIGNASGAAGNVVSNQGDGMLGAAIGTVGSLTDVGIDAANSGGNLGNYINNTIGSGQTQGALSNVQNAYDERTQQDEQWRNAANEVKEQQEEQIKKGLDDLNKQSKQEKCSRCNAENDARLKSGQPTKSCFSECS